MTDQPNQINAQFQPCPGSGAPSVMPSVCGFCGEEFELNFDVMGVESIPRHGITVHPEGYEASPPGPTKTVRIKDFQGTISSADDYPKPCSGPVKSGHRCVLAEGHEGMHEVEETFEPCDGPVMVGGPCVLERGHVGFHEPGALIDPREAELAHDIIHRGPRLEYEHPESRQEFDSLVFKPDGTPKDLGFPVDKQERYQRTQARKLNVEAVAQGLDPGTLPRLLCVCGSALFTVALDPTPERFLGPKSPHLHVGAKGRLVLDCIKCSNRMSWPLAVADRQELETHWTGPLAEDPTGNVPR